MAETTVSSGVVKNILTLDASEVKDDIAVKLSLAFTNNNIDQTITHDVFGRTRVHLIEMQILINNTAIIFY